MYTDILLPLDLDQESSWRKALPTAIGECRAFGARLHIITVIPDFGMTIVGEYFPVDYEEKAISRGMKALSAFVREHVPEDVPVQKIVAHGTVYQEILKAAAETGCDLIVMASHRPALKDYLLGPNAARVVRHAPCSVMVVREAKEETAAD